MPETLNASNRKSLYELRATMVRELQTSTRGAGRTSRFRRQREFAEAWTCLSERGALPSFTRAVESGDRDALLRLADHVPTRLGFENELFRLATGLIDARSMAAA